MYRKLRTNKLPKPGLQLRLTLVFLLTACAALLVQFVLLNRLLVLLARRLPDQADVLTEEWPSMLVTTLGLSIALMVPFTVGVGVLSTFRVAGPLYRFETYMRAILRGEDPGPCRIRSGDYLQDFCGLLNQLVTTLRTPSAARPASGSSIDEVPSLTHPEAPARDQIPAR